MHSRDAIIVCTLKRGLGSHEKSIIEGTQIVQIHVLLWAILPFGVLTSDDVCTYWRNGDL
jgi:hypothetical protein